MPPKFTYYWAKLGQQVVFIGAFYEIMRFMKDNWLAGKIFRQSTNIKRNILLFLLCILAMPLNSCSFLQSCWDIVQTGDEDAKALQNNSNKLIGGLYEVQNLQKLAGVKSYQTILDLRRVAKERGLSPESSPLQIGQQLGTEFFNSGLVQNLNVEANAEDRKTKLIFKVIDIQKLNQETKSDQEIFVKIKVLNKKYFDTTWWITGHEFILDALRVGHGLK